MRREWRLLRGVVAVGALGFAIDAGILTLLVNGAGWGHYAARLASFTVAVTCTWYCARRWVFRSNADARREYHAFFATQATGAALNWAVYASLIENDPALARWPVVPLAAGAIVAFAFNYLAMRVFVFAGERVPAADECGYSGIENLESMQHAKNYNAHLLRLIERYTRGPVTLEFGAGTGTFAEPIARSGREVVCVELDDVLRRRLQALGLRAYADLASVPNADIDSMYSLNVLEHVRDDQSVLEELYARLKPGGALLVYVPAFNVLFTSMDRKVGHFRRYRNLPLQRQLREAGFEIVVGRYVDSIGFLATLVYKVIGDRSGVVSAAAVKAYDRFVFPASRWLDTVCCRLFGKNVLVVARKPR
jgi:putative flippase GtrA